MLTRPRRAAGRSAGRRSLTLDRRDRVRRPVHPRVRADGAGPQRDRVRPGDRRLLRQRATPPSSWWSGLYVLPFAGIAFLWFIVTLRMWAAASGRRLNALQSNLQLVSGILFVALFFVGAAAMSVVAGQRAVRRGRGRPGGVAPVPASSAARCILFFSMRMAAMFVFTTSALGRSAEDPAALVRARRVRRRPVPAAQRRLHAGPRPGFPAWVLVLCLILLRNARDIPKDARLPGRIGAGSFDPIGAGRVFAPPGSGKAPLDD